MGAKGRFSEKIFPGAKFNRLTVIRRIPGGQGRRAKILCHCDCGNTIEIDCSNLTNNNSKSCGCLNNEQRRQTSQARVNPNEGYAKVIPGARFTLLTIITRLRENGKYTGKVECMCDCGTLCLRYIDALVAGNATSCGCRKRAITIARNKEIAKYDSFSSTYPKTWMRWISMISRCYNEKSKPYSTYGAVGIIVCKYIKESPWNLLELIGPCKNLLPSLDRFPIHNGNYTCGRCEECRVNNWQLNIRWATRKDQSNNRGDFNVLLTAFGKTLTRGQWADLSKINEWTIKRRIDRGWGIEKALTTPDKLGNCYIPPITISSV